MQRFELFSHQRGLRLATIVLLTGIVLTGSCWAQTDPGPRGGPAGAGGPVAFALHHMGPKLADQISQGLAGGDEFRTVPLWGLGQRLFFLHDGRETDLVKVIADHASQANSQFPASEANEAVERFNALNAGQKQAILNFLRSL